MTTRHLFGHNARIRFAAGKEGNGKELNAKSKTEFGMQYPILLDESGKAAHVWTIREFKFNPPLAAFTRSIVDALRQWEYTPVIVGATAVVACTALMIDVEWS